MNIMYVIPYVPSRIRVRSFELLRALAKRQHTLTLATLWSSAEERQDLDFLRAAGIHVVDCYLPPIRSYANALLALPTTTPLQAVYCWEPQFARKLVQIAVDRQVDVIHVEHLRGARYGLYLKQHVAEAGFPVPVIWDSVDCITHLFRQAAQRSQSFKGRLLSRMELGRTSRYEGWLLEQFDRALVTAQTDQRALEQLAKENVGNGALGHPCPVDVVPNGVDLDYFSLGQTARLPATLVLTGKMSYHANSTAAQFLVHEIMPLVWAKRADVDVWIVGKDPSRAIAALANATSTGTGHVVVTGTVPDIRPYLHRATIAVAPVPYGAGIQNKVLEAMACGTPVIASEQAISALQVQEQKDLLIARTPQEFADAILRLLATPTEQALIGQSGRDYVEKHHAWPSIARQLESIYTSLLHESQSVSAATQSSHAIPSY